MPSLLRAETIMKEGRAKRTSLAGLTVPNILLPEARMWQNKDLASLMKTMVIV